MDAKSRIVFVGRLRKKETNPLSNLLNTNPDPDKICLHVSSFSPRICHPYENKYQYLLNKRQKIAEKNFENSNAFFKHSSEINDV